MVVVGLTGSLATGKSTVAAMFNNFGAELFNADQTVHQLIKTTGACYRPVVGLLGSEILTRGEIDRRKVARIVFQNKEKLKKLERILHPAVKKEMIKNIKQWKKQKQNKIIVLDVPLLFESGLDRFVDATVVVKASRKDQLKRAQQRLKISYSEASRRIDAQMPLTDKLDLSDHIINNNTEKKQTRKQVKKLWQELQPKIKK